MRFFFAPRNLFVACLAAALVTVVWVPLCFGPGGNPHKNKKWRINVVAYNPGALFVEHSAHIGIATAGPNAGFTVHTLLLIYDAEGGELCAVLEQEDPLFIREGAQRDADGFTPLAPQIIEWDGICPSDPSQVFVVVLSEVLNPGGRSITSALDMFIVDISDPDR